MATLETDARAIFSTLATDPDMGELVDLFVGELSERIDGLRTAMERADFETLGRYAHQLKGAAGSYGFDALTPALKQLEQAVRDARTEEEVRQLLTTVIELCQRVRAGVPE